MRVVNEITRQGDAEEKASEQAAVSLCRAASQGLGT